jgi:hypothetical protein
VISVLLYGRNDTHGYNLHRRAALSLNCIAEVLDDPQDEMIFVDYNTPEELPTFIEAISDTLTEKCLDLLRIFRVSAALHEQLFARRTHLPAIEPVARNVAARRSNPSNRWLLSTNTDMIFVPAPNRSLSEICKQLPDGFYALPRFELPEWVWETLPRSDPRSAIEEIERWGPALCLDEPTMSYEWILFDAPGDFQLVLRDDFFAIDGFNEEMLLGYHVDSNLNRRMLLRRGSIQTADRCVAAYHCNHNRLATVYHGARPVTNDPERFLVSTRQAELPEQRAGWGLNGTELDQVPSKPLGQRLVETVVRAIGDDVGRRGISDAKEMRRVITYDSAHVLPFAADLLVLAPPKTTVGYVGANPVLHRMLGALVSDLGHRFVAAQIGDEASLDSLDRAAEVLVIDLGIDRSLVGGELDTDSPRLPEGLASASRIFRRLIERERSRIQAGAYPRRFVLINSTNALWDAYVLAQMDCSYSTYHSRVRRAVVKLVPDAEDAAAIAAVNRAESLLRFSTRPSGRLALRPGKSVSVAALDDYRGFGDGWAFPDDWGIWTQGPQSLLALELSSGSKKDATLALWIGSVCIGPNDSLEAELFVDGTHVSTHSFTDPFREYVWRFTLPEEAFDRQSANVTLVVHDPRSPTSIGWSGDDRPLGLHLRAVSFGSVRSSRTVHRLIRRLLWRARAGYARLGVNGRRRVIATEESRGILHGPRSLTRR